MSHIYHYDDLCVHAVFKKSGDLIIYSTDKFF